MTEKQSKPYVCRHGHTEGRSNNGRCKTCRRAYESRRKPKWLKEHDALWLIVAHRSLKRRGDGPYATKRELFALWQKQGGRCALTGLPIVGRAHLDHIEARSGGGNNLIANLQWTDGMANQAKATNTVAEFRSWLLQAAEALKAKIAAEELY
jgi:hypothetical protein